MKFGKEKRKKPGEKPTHETHMETEIRTWDPSDGREAPNRLKGSKYQNNNLSKHVNKII